MCLETDLECGNSHLGHDFELGEVMTRVTQLTCLVESIKETKIDLIVGETELEQYFMTEMNELQN